MIKTVGSVCSGIEAASVAWKPLGLKFEWFSEIAAFPCQILNEKYPEVKNLGDMKNIPDMLRCKKINSPDLICGGTPCQAFSLAGWKSGLNDDRGNLTLKFVDIVDANDEIRQAENKSRTIVFWENVEGVLTDKTNAFGCLVSTLAGLSNVIKLNKWPCAGLIRGPKRNVAWRVLDAKFFGVPQQRRRLYLLAGDKTFHPENILFEKHLCELKEYPHSSLSFVKHGHNFEVFREYTDCLYSAYGTKWNGNAAANNGSLFIVQDNRIRRLSPLECERLMGFPDNYTYLPMAKKTNRYQAIGNSWAVPVIRWIGNRIISNSETFIVENKGWCSIYASEVENDGIFFNFGKDIININGDEQINCTSIPESPIISSMFDIVSESAPEDIYISPVGCYGIIRRTQERNNKINPRLLEILQIISSQMSLVNIEIKSRAQKRGQYSS